VGLNNYAFLLGSTGVTTSSCHLSHKVEERETYPYFLWFSLWRCKAEPRKVERLMNWRILGRKRLWTNWGNITILSCRGWRKTTKSLSQDSPCHGRDSNRILPEYKSRASHMYQPVLLQICYTFKIISCKSCIYVMPLDDNIIMPVCLFSFISSELTNFHETCSEHHATLIILNSCPI
jgi:hypothetical protein